MQDKLMYSHLSDDMSFSRDVTIGLTSSELLILRKASKWINYIKWATLIFGILGTVAHLGLLIYTERWILMSLIHSAGSPGRPPQVLQIFAVFDILLVLADVLLVVLKIRVIYFLSSFHYAFNTQGIGWAHGTMLQITVLRFLLCGIGLFMLYKCDLHHISTLGFVLLVFSCGLGNLVFELTILLSIRYIKKVHGKEKSAVEHIRQIILLAKKRLTITDFRRHNSQDHSLKQNQERL
jgi:hypothetical protein